MNNKNSIIRSVGYIPATQYLLVGTGGNYGSHIPIINNTANFRVTKGLYLFRGDFPIELGHMCMSGDISGHTNTFGAIRFVLATNLTDSEPQWVEPIIDAIARLYRTTIFRTNNLYYDLEYVLRRHNSPPYNINDNHIWYYYAEIDIKNKTFSIGEYRNSKSTILKTIQFNKNLVMNGNLTFSCFHKSSNTTECSARWIHAGGEQFTLTQDIPLKTRSDGYFGLALPDFTTATINNFDFGIRSLNDKFVISKPDTKVFTINFVYDNKPTSINYPVYLNKLVQNVNAIFSENGLNAKFEMIGAQPETFTEPNLFTYATGDGDFNYAVTSGKVLCTCGEGSVCAVGCAPYPIPICFGTGWISLKNWECRDSHLLAHELGHNFGAEHGGGIMAPVVGCSRFYTSQSIVSIESGLFGPCAAKATIESGLPQYNYVPPPPPIPPDDPIHDFIFTTDLPDSLYLSDNASLNLSTRVSPINKFGYELVNFPKNSYEKRLAGQIASVCRSNPGCYKWERKFDDGPWETVRFLKAPEGRDYSTIFSLPSAYSSMKIRCVVTLRNVEKSSKICTIYRRPLNSIYTFTSYIETFIYPSNLPIFNISASLPPDTIDSIRTISASDGVAWYNKKLISSSKISKMSLSSKDKLLPGQAYTIYFNSPSIPGVTATNLPITINWIPQYDGPGAPAADYVPDTGDFPTYNIDSSWSQTVSNNSTILFDKQMIVPIEDITNIEYVNKIYTQQNNELYIWQKDYIFSNLKTLNYNTAYNIELNTNNPVELSYIL